MTDYYSQLGQDKWILEEVYPETEGIFVDIGAGDGVRHSNTKSLEDNGWDGLCVEPSRYSVKDFIDNRPNTKLDTRCVYDGSLVTFREMVPENDFYPQTSGISNVYDMTNNWSNYREIKVPSIELHNLLDDWAMSSFIHYLSIDVEGAEVDLLRHFDFSYQFGAITIEHNHRQDDKINILNLMNENGYELIKDKEWEFFFINNAT